MADWCTQWTQDREVVGSNPSWDSNLLEPGIGQNIAFHAPPAVRTSTHLGYLVSSLVFQFHFFPQTSSNIKMKVFLHSESEFDLW